METNQTKYSELVPIGKQVRWATSEDVYYVLKRARKEDREEIFLGSGGVTDLVILTDRILKSAILAFTVTDTNGFPVVILTVYEVGDHSWRTGYFASDDFNHVFTTASKCVKKFIKNAIKFKLAGKVEALCLCSNTKTHQWLSWLGGKKEGSIHDFGTPGTEFYRYVWRLETYEADTN